MSISNPRLEIIPSSNEGIWKALYLYKQGVRQVQNCIAFDETLNLIQRVDICKSGVGYIYFSVLQSVFPHCGPCNIKLRCLLPLQVPEGCGLKVADQIKYFEEGKCLIFDDSFEHSSWYKGTSDLLRVVLIIDFWHPDLTESEKSTLSDLPL